MSIKFGFKKSSIAFTALLLSIGMTAKAGVVYDYIKNNNELMGYSSINAISVNSLISVTNSNII